MAEQKTEKPTQQRVRRAREKGQFPAAKEFVSAAQFLLIALIITTMSPALWERAKVGLREALLQAFRSEIELATWISMCQTLIIGAFTPLLLPAVLVLVATVLLQLGSTNMGFSLQKLAPNFSKFKPMAKLKEIPRNNVPAAGQALVVLLIVGWSIYAIARDQLPLLMALPMAGIETGLNTVASSASQVLWRGVMVLVGIGLIELFRQRWLYNKDLRMTKQEVRQEHKDQEGDPILKARVRRLRHAMLRQQMMKEVPQATAVVVNPTHYAIAIRYDSASMSAPKVVAKGRNLVAARIRALANEHSVPVIENPPLARALYKAVDVGREIPPDFFRAVAEVLAYVYRTTGYKTVNG